ncbi:MAG TPA: hypothetical protein DCZ92_09010 [Elusimicrobia bacterium]|nr:MAG: hypothetical protein A2016_05970 [Elusimicrobia bacterium GWF2_62_30]HBA60944.1 hypothetical protein [Elusimicrobiota bacterium]
MASILIIDDDGIVRDALNVFLTRSGHTVTTAPDGGNGLLVFRSTKPDLVILDRDLPIMSGSVVFDKIREISKDVPVIILTGFNAPQEAAAYLRCGAAAFLSKGDGLSNVLAEVDRVLGIEPAPKPAASRPRPAGEKNAAPVSSTGLLLVADDDEETRKLLTRFLSSMGYTVISAEDGPAAIELARQRKPDLILLDIFMPGKNGLEVLKELAPELPDTGFMMITGNDDEDVARDCLEHGAFDYVSKPVNLNILGDTIKARLLSQKK